MRIDRIKFVSEMMKRDLTQCKLAEMSGVSRVTIGYIKAGKSCSDEVGQKLAKALGVKLKISYEHEEDLARILTVLRPMIIRCKRSGNTQGRYKKAYVELEHVMKSGESREENGLKQGRSPGKA